MRIKKKLYTIAFKVIFVLEDMWRESDFLFHRGTIDRINHILQTGELRVSENKKGISFTKGITPIPGHGDTAIVFKTDFLNRKEIETKIINYDDRMMIDEYCILESPGKIRKEEAERMKFHLNISKIKVDVFPSNPEIRMIHEVLEKQLDPSKLESLSDEMINNQQILEYRNWEKEILAETSKIEFNDSDIIAVISLHRFFEDDFSGIRKYSEKTIYLDDLKRYENGYAHVLWDEETFPDIVNNRILELKKLESKIPMIKNVREHSLVVYHLACYMIDNFEKYSVLKNFMPEQKFPTPPDSLRNYLSELHKLPNDWFKTYFIDRFEERLLSDQSLILYEEKIDEMYIEEISSRLALV